MTIRLEIDTAYNCRPHKGERRGPGGRLVKCAISFAATLDEALAEAQQARAASERIAPGYSEIIAIRAYDNESFRIDPLKAQPVYSIPTLAA